MKVEITMDDRIATALADALEKYNGYRTSGGLSADTGWEDFAHNLRTVSNGTRDSAGDDEITVTTP